MALLLPVAPTAAKAATPAAVERPSTSPTGYAELPFGWGRMSFQIVGTGTYVLNFHGSVANTTDTWPPTYFAARAGIWYNSHWDWMTNWIIVAPCFYWPVAWYPGRVPGKGGFMPAGNYSMIVQVQWGALWGESSITWNVHR